MARGEVSPGEFGAVANGGSHPIAAIDIARNPQWRGSYAVGDERDYIALQEAIYAAFGGPADDGTPTGWHKATYARLNRPVIIPGGNYRINKTLQVKATTGFRIQGAGRLATAITQVSQNAPVLHADGLSYGTIEGLTFQAFAPNSEAIVELDWTGSIASLRPQQISINDCVFHGQGQSAYGLRIAKSGGGAQGDTILLNNDLFIGCTEAGLATGNGAYNALSITLIGGDVQDCRRYGIKTVGGSVYVYGTSFQNSDNLADYYAATGVSERIIFSAVRSESLRIIKNDTYAQHFIIDGLDQNFARRSFQRNTTYARDDLVMSNDGRAFKVTTAGATGAAEPNFAAVSSGGTLTSGSVTFTQYEFYTIESPHLTLRSSHITGGKVKIASSVYPSLIENTSFSRADWLERGIPDDASATGKNLVTLVSNHVTNGAPWAVVGVGNYGAPYYAPSQLNLGSQPIIFSRGGSGQPFRDVGIAPGDGVGVFPGQAELDLSRNVLAVIGTLGRITRAGADQRGEDLLVQGGLGTGSGGGGAIRLRAQAPAASGTSVPNAADKVVIDYRGVAVGGGASITRHLSAATQWDPPSLAHGATTTTSVTVPDANVGDVVSVGFSSITEGGWQISAQVTASNTVTVTLTNQGGRVADLSSGTIRASVTQY